MQLPELRTTNADSTSSGPWVFAVYSQSKRSVMQAIASLKLIRFFDFYLALIFLLSTAIRLHQYRLILNVVRSVPSRWPRLFDFVKRHRGLFLTWRMISPLVLSFLLFAIHTIVRRIALTDRDALTVEQLSHMILGIPVLITGLAMVAFDIWGLVQVTELDQKYLEECFDQAEYWLRSWTAPVVRVFTLGYINPRRMVHTEVQKALVDASEIINQSLWWMTIQVTLRLLFGITLWIAFIYSVA